MNTPLGQVAHLTSGLLACQVLSQLKRGPPVTGARKFLQEERAQQSVSAGLQATLLQHKAVVGGQSHTPLMHVWRGQGRHALGQLPQC